MLYERHHTIPHRIGAIYFTKFAVETGSGGYRNVFSEKKGAAQRGRQEDAGDILERQ